MTSASFPRPDELTEQEQRLLIEWADVQPESNPLAAAGAARNVMRNAHAWGPKLIAAMVAEGLEPCGDPEMFLQDLLSRVER